MEKMIGDADDQIYEPNDVAPHHRPCAGHSFYKRYANAIKVTLNNNGSQVNDQVV